MGLSLGILAGFSGMTGAPVIATFVVIVLSTSYFYQNNFLELDSDDFNPNELLMEGASNAVGLFLLSWILIYSFI